MLEGKLNYYESVPTAGIRPDMVAFVEETIVSRRRQSALSISRPLFWGANAACGFILVVWVLFPEYAQLLMTTAAILPLSITAGLYPILHRQERFQAGIQLILYSLFFTVFVVPILMPSIIVAVGLGYLVLLAMGNTFLGIRESRLLTGLCVPALAIDLGLFTTWAPEFFPEQLEENYQIVLSTLVGILALVVVIVILRLIVGGQEEASRQALLANQMVEERAQAELLQRKALQSTVERYVAHMIEVGRGNLTARLTIDGNKSEENSPLIVLGRSLNEMTGNLKGMIVQIREAARQLNESAAEIQAAATQQTASASEQNATVTQTVATVEEVRATVVQTAERAQNVAGASQQSVTVSRDGQQAISDTVEGMRMIQERVETIAETILVLSERTQQIGEIVETVNALADQSKLLALNASIEAARAGEEGKGFAVVAMEVRQLAEQSREATARIGGILTEIQDATNMAVMVTEEGGKGADQGMGLAEHAGEAIRELAAIIERAAQASTQIAASTHQQTNGMDQLSAAMAQIKQATTQAAASAKQTEQGVRDLLNMARELEEAAALYQVT
jgi:methyl-accepting chemotaxis protein